MTLGMVGRRAAQELGVCPQQVRLVHPAHGGFPWSSKLPAGSLATDSVALASLAANIVAVARFGITRRAGARG
jgi:hypothetical protein